MDSPLERLHGLYEEWGRGDFSRDLFEPEVVSHLSGWIDLGEEIRGADQVRAEMRKWLSTWELPLVIEADEFIESGHRILVLIRWRGRGRGSGVDFESEGAHLWTFRDGRVARWDVYRDRDEARAALGEAGQGADT